MFPLLSLIETVKTQFIICISISKLVISLLFRRFRLRLLTVWITTKRKAWLVGGARCNHPHVSTVQGTESNCMAGDVSNIHTTIRIIGTIVYPYLLYSTQGGGASIFIHSESLYENKLK